MDNTSVDFFTNIVTVSIVLVFAKFVTHHNRRGPTTGWTHAWHLVCVIVSVAAVAMGLAGVELETDPDPWFHILAAAAMAAGIIILLADVLANDWQRVDRASHGRTDDTGAGRPDRRPAES